jgi:hypothetical protein
MMTGYTRALGGSRVNERLWADKPDCIRVVMKRALACGQNMDSL